jgi:O-antigen biosynthesis protein
MQGPNETELKKKYGFDLYGRYAIIRDIINVNRRDGMAFKVLDVGGRGNIMKNFLPSDDVHYLDLHIDTDDKNYIEGDGCNMPFPDASFDWVVSADVLEHIVSDQRERFLKENLRVAILGVIVVAPFYTEDIYQAEINANENYKLLSGIDHVWLKEHILQGLPSIQDIERFLSQNNYRYQLLQNNNLFLWQFLMGMIFITEDEQEEIEKFNFFYNTEVYPSDYLAPAYRRVYFIKKYPDLNDLHIPDVKISSTLYLKTIQTGLSFIIDHYRKKKEKVDQLTLNVKRYKERIAYLTEKERKLDEILNSHGWKLLVKYYHLRDALLPPDKKRTAIAKYIFHSIIDIKSEIKSAYHKFRNKNHIKGSSKNNKTFITNRSTNVTMNEELSRVEIERQKNRKFLFEPLISIVVDLNTKAPLNFVEEMFGSLLHQTYSKWECVARIDDDAYSMDLVELYSKKEPRIKTVIHERKSESIDILKILSSVTGEFIILLDQIDILSPSTLYEVVNFLNENHDADLLYFDEATICNDGRTKITPVYKPGWSPDTLRSFNYIGRGKILKKALLESGVSTLRPGESINGDYDLILRTSEKAKNIVHIPKVLYFHRSVNDGENSGNALNWRGKDVLAKHLTRVGLDAKIQEGLLPNIPRIEYSLTRRPKVSIIIPNRDNAQILKMCITSILKKTTYDNYEILIVDNNSNEQITAEYYKSLKNNSRIKQISWHNPFNYSAINNYAVTKATGEYLLFLNNDVEVITPAWIERLLEHAQKKEVGAVGGKLYYPDGTIQHAGIIVGIGGIAGHLHRYKPKTDNGYQYSLKSVRNVSAVTGACMMMSKEVFGSAGMFDENMEINFGDVDLCLKMQLKGFLNLFTPFAELIHHEKLTRAKIESPDKLPSEMAYFKDKWGEYLTHGDPFFNPNITISSEKNMEVYLDRMRSASLTCRAIKTNYLLTFDALDKFFSYSFIILNKDKPELIKKCIEKIREDSVSQNYEIIIGDTGSTDRKTLAFYDEIKDSCRVIFLPYYNFSQNNNELARLANKRIIIFLNNDVFISGNYLSRLGRYFVLPRVGIVGCRLLFEDGRLQHAGIEFIMEKGPYKYLGYHPYRLGDASLPDANVIKSVYSVTGACLMVDKKLFFEIGCFDEQYQSECQDVDLCLRVKELGYEIVYDGTVHAVHLENASRQKGEEDWKDRSRLTTRWKDYLDVLFRSGNKQSPVFSPHVLFIRERERGDVLASTAVIREFKRRFPSSKLYFKTNFRELLVNNMNIDGLIDSINIDDYDCIVDLTYEIGNWESTWLKSFFKCVGYRKSEITDEMQVPDFSVIQEKEFAAKLPSKFIVIAPNAGWTQREWPHDKWIEFSKLVTERMKLPVIQVGAGSDKIVDGCIDWRGVSFNKLGILMSRASAFVGCDSFPLHMAHALLPNKSNMVIITCATSSDNVNIGSGTEIRDNSCKACRKLYGEGMDVLLCKAPQIAMIPAARIFQEVQRILG